MSNNGNGLLEYIPGSKVLLVQKNSSLPLEGFAENIRISITEFAENSKNEVEKGNNFLQWVLTRVFEATEEDRKSTRLNSSHVRTSRMPSSA